MTDTGFDLFDIPKRLNDSGAGATLYYVAHKTSSGGYFGVMEKVSRNRAFSNLSAARAAARGYLVTGAQITCIVMVDQTGQCMFTVEPQSGDPKDKPYADFGSW